MPAKNKSDNPFKGVNPLGDSVEIYEILEQIVETKQGVKCKGYKGMTPLHYAAYLTRSFELNKIEPIIEQLLALGANVGTKDREGKLAFEHLSGAKSLKALLTKLTPKTKKSSPKDKETTLRMLFEAIFLNTDKVDSEDPDCLAVLESIVDIEQYENLYLGGDKLIHTAAFSGNIVAINHMHKKGFDIHGKNKSFQPPIIIAAQKGYVNTLSLLIALGANPNAIGYRGNTPLHEIAGSYISIKKNETIKTLISLGGDTKLYNRAGDTPLHKAIICGNLTEVKSFIENGADINFPDKNGFTPLKVAREEKVKDSIVSFLLDHGAVES